jgi:hypothetical protein
LLHKRGRMRVEESNSLDEICFLIDLHLGRAYIESKLRVQTLSEGLGCCIIPNHIQEGPLISI